MWDSESIFNKEMSRFPNFNTSIKQMPNFISFLFPVKHEKEVPVSSFVQEIFHWLWEPDFVH